MATMTDSPGPLLSTTETGRRLGITTREVYDLIEAGELPGFRTQHGMQVPESAVNARRA